MFLITQKKYKNGVWGFFYFPHTPKGLCHKDSIPLMAINGFLLSFLIDLAGEEQLVMFVLTSEN